MAKPLRVLIIEDNEDDAYLLINVLKEGGYEPDYERVQISAGLKNALEQKEWDCIISDYSMPQYNGLDALREFKEFSLDIPFILVSGTIGEETAVTAMKAGAHDYIMKDKMARLIPALERELVDAEDRRKRRQAELELFNLRKAVDASAEAIFMTDIDGVFTFINKGFTLLYGYTSAEVIGKVTPRLLKSIEAMPEQYKTLWNSLLKGQEIRSEMRNKTKDGRIVIIDSSVNTILDDKGTITGFLAIQSDITERKVSEEALRANEEQFRLISENVADMIAVLDLEGRRIYNSPSYRSLVGDPDLLRGTDSFQEIHPEDRERIKAVFQETVKSGIGQRSEYRFVTKDGTIRNIESQGSVIRYRDGKTANVLVVSRDITDKKELEQQFLRMQRLDSIGTLAGGIAHDLNNVLSPILLAIEILSKSIRNDTERRMFETLDSCARRGSEIVKQILAFARGVKGERIMLQPRHLAEEIISIVKETFPKSITVKTDISKNTWPIIGDATQFHQLIMNLCINARDAMLPNGGTLTLSAENAVIDQEFTRMHLEANLGRYIMFSVEDTGTGIPPEILGHIFEPFFSTKKIGKGSGLGLSTVHTIVKSHGGFITVQSDPGMGATFKVYLPAAEGTETKKEQPADKASMKGHGECILVVDDEASICHITKLTLEAFGYRVITASEGTEAVALYISSGSEIDLVITDMMMPIMDGPKMILALRKLNPVVKIIASSGLIANEITILGDESSPDAFISKPYTAENLLGKVYEVLHNVRS